MARITVPIGEFARAHTCVVCGETEDVTLEPVSFRPVGLLALVVLYFCGFLFVPVYFWIVPARTVHLPFSRSCFATWNRLRKASLVLAVVGFFIPYVGFLDPRNPDFMLKTTGTAIVVLLVPLLFRFGPAVLGPVCRRVYPKELVLEIPDADAAAAIEREGFSVMTYDSYG